MKDDDELESLLGEIPHAISFNLSNIHHLKHGHGGDHHQERSFMTPKMNGRVCGFGMYDDAVLSHNKRTCASPMSGFSLQSDGSSSSLFSGGHSLSDNGSPTTPPLEELKPHSHCGSTHFPNRLWMDMRTPDSCFGKKANENVIDELSLSRNLSRMYISEEPEDVILDSNGNQFCDRVSCGTVGVDFDQHRLSLQSNGISDYGIFQLTIPGNHMNFEGEMASAMLGLGHDYRLGNQVASQYSPGGSGELFSQLNGGNGAVNSQFFYTKKQAGHHYMGFPVSNISTLARPSMADASSYAKLNGTSVLAENDAFHLLNVPQLATQKSHKNMENVMHCHLQMTSGFNILPSHVKVTHGSLESLSAEDSLIMQEENASFVAKIGYERSRHNNQSSPYLSDVNAHQVKRSLFHCRPQIAGSQESDLSLRPSCPFSLPSKCTSLAEAQGYIYCIAKDQHGCRFLQRMFDEGTPQDVQIIFNEVIDHVVELMMNPFGNYLMQKLLEVCNEEQRMQILLRVTAKPGELIRISLNTHGTRVVQKLMETLKSRQQISLVITALEPGFLALIKDLNGNHVVQRCLQCLSNDDSKFIFVAAAKYCVDIATHQHGCCVLQRCISHSSGEHQESLIAEISANALLLAQDAFGNYVVQFILELKIPSATTKLVSQFERNYVHLSTQKFSSHVVEKCLVACSNDVRSKIIHELLAVTHFEQLLLDPHANYVVQTALKVSEGPLHNLLVDAIEAHKAMSRNSPYSKRIFSHKLLKK